MVKLLLLGLTPVLDSARRYSELCTPLCFFAGSCLPYSLPLNSHAFMHIRAIRLPQLRNNLNSKVHSASHTHLHLLG